MNELPAWALGVTTPALIYDLDRLRKTAALLRGSIERAGGVCCYSVKANRHPRILRELAEQGLGADIASAAELDAACEAGLAPLVATGPGLSTEVMVAVDERGGTLFFDHVAQVERAAAAGIELARHGVRLAMPGSYAAFGFSTDELGVLVERGFRPRRLHAHAGELLDVDDLDARLARIRAQSATLDPEVIDIGGGFGLLSNHPERLERAFLRLTAFARETGVRLIIEPGKVAVARSGVLVTRVVARKQRGDLQIAVVDASSFNLGDMEARRLWATSARGPASHPTSIVGPTCYEGDVWGKFLAPRLAEGDRLVFATMGAYTRSIASELHGLPAPAESFMSASPLA